MAQETPWQKPAASWTAVEAQQILRQSPWSAALAPQIIRPQNEAVRREAGAMGLPSGVGYDGFGDTRPRVQLPSSLLGKTDMLPPPSATPKLSLLLRWESALPVRVAELETRQIGAPVFDDNAYTLVVYGLPGTFVGDPEKLGRPLKNFASIQVDGGRVIHPERAEVYQLETGAAIVYTFPRFQVGQQNGTLSFTAQIGEIAVAHAFDLPEMVYAGKLQL